MGVAGPGRCTGTSLLAPNSSDTCSGARVGQGAVAECVGSLAGDLREPYLGLNDRSLSTLGFPGGGGTGGLTGAGVLTA